MNKKVIRSLAVMLIAVMFVSMMPAKAFAATKSPAKVKILSLKVGEVSPSTNKTTVTIKWKKAARATGYIIYYKRGDGQWVKQKKVGRLSRKYKFTGVPAGKMSFRVRAVNKKKLGKYSAIKTKFKASQMTLQQYVNRVEPEAKSLKISGGTVSYAANQMIVSYDVYNIYSDAADIDWNNLSESQRAVLITYLMDTAHAKEMADYYRNRAKLYVGITNFRYTARFVQHGNPIPGAYVSY